MVLSDLERIFNSVFFEREVTAGKKSTLRRERLVKREAKGKQRNRLGNKIKKVHNLFK
jgi:hypothetical protein